MGEAGSQAGISGAIGGFGGSATGVVRKSKIGVRSWTDLNCLTHPQPVAKMPKVNPP